MSQLLELLVDGAPAASNWPLDRGLQYGDGLFETMRVQRRQICFEALHRARLAAGCARLFIHVDEKLIWDQARALAARHENAILRLQVTRGVALARGYTPTGREQAVCILAMFQAHPGDLPADPVRVCTLTSRIGENPQLAGLKHCNRLEQVLARQSMAGSNAFEGLLASSSGLLISGTMSNVFLELDGQLMTPAVDRCGVAGVMRQVVLREAARAGSPVRVCDIPVESVARITALALSNARLGLVPAGELDGRVLQDNAQLIALAAGVRGLES